MLGTAYFSHNQGSNQLLEHVAALTFFLKFLDPDPSSFDFWKLILNFDFAEVGWEYSLVVGLSMPEMTVYDALCQNITSG